MIPMTKWLDEGQYDDEKTLEEIKLPSVIRLDCLKRELFTRTSIIGISLYDDPVPVKERKRPNLFIRLFLKFFFKKEIK